MADESKGLTYYQEEDGIHVYKISALTREVIDKLIELGKHHDQADYAAGKHARSLLIGEKLWLTPYFIQEAVKLAWATPLDLRESFAIVTSTDSVFMNMIRGVLHRFPKKTLQNIRIFSQEDQARRWLDERHQLLGD